MTSRPRVDLLVLDIDGVLTDGRVLLGSNGVEYKAISFRDLDAVADVKRLGVRLALITGEDGPWVDQIAQRLAPDIVVRGEKDKLAGLTRVCAQLGVELAKTCYVGDADRDARALEAVGFGLAPANASTKAKTSAKLVLTASGGNMAVAEAVTAIVTSATYSASVDDVIGRTSRSESHTWERVRRAVRDSVTATQSISEHMLEDVEVASSMISASFKNRGKLLLFGNGGSAAIAQHMAGEFIGRFRLERRALPAVALTTDSSVITAIANDYGSGMLFARQVEALGNPGDVVVAFSTSGNSPNVLIAARAARNQGLKIIGMTGNSGGALSTVCDVCFRVPSNDTPRIQEAHEVLMHILCELVEFASAEQT